ncbi:MAG: hypothetical protein MJ209_03270 [archaeon]|nr:hypothetical protein [archaeon]
MFKSNHKHLNKYSIAFIAIIIIFTALRIYLSLKLPYYFAQNGVNDDLFLLSASDLPYYFHHWNLWSLSKNILFFFSLFLFFIDVSGIPYSLYYSLLWVFSGLFLLYACWRFISKNKIFLLLAYLFILFLPFGFDTFSAARIYRNSVFIPLWFCF